VHPKSIYEILIELEDNIKNKGIMVGMVPKITKDILKEHIIGPSKEINLINSFFSTFKREMGPIYMSFI
jgi:hypothetical protein